MEWLDPRVVFSDREFERLDFRPNQTFEVQTIRLQRDQHNVMLVNGTANTNGLANGRVTPHSEYRLDKHNHLSEADYRSWLQSTLTVPVGPQQSGVILVMHRRLTPDDGDPDDPPRTMSLPYTQDTFRIGTERLFQHRSLASIIKSDSPTVFNKRTVSWSAEPPLDSLIVYNCRSDTISFRGSELEEPSDIVLSVTTSPSLRTTYAVMYGCTRPMMNLTSSWLRDFKDQPLHPLILPLIFAEHERKRLLNRLDREKTAIQRLIQALNDRLNLGHGIQVDEDQHTPQTDSAQLKIGVSSLINGLEGLKSQLHKMMTESDELSTNVFKPGANSSTGIDAYVEERKMGVIIDNRLSEIRDEIDGTVRRCSTLMVELDSVTKLEAKFRERIEARISMLNAVNTTNITKLGMLFLPGASLATLFSSSMFNWRAETRSDIASPWLGLWGGLAITITVLLFLAAKRLQKREEKAEHQTDGDARQNGGMV